jgi:Xaa-Pro dipeptidase
VRLVSSGQLIMGVVVIVLQHWVGALPTLEQLAEEYGADDCAYMDDAPRLLKACDAPVIHSLPDKVGALSQPPGVFSS